MKTLLYAITVIVLVVMEYLSINMFFFRYVEWIIIYAAGVYWFGDQKNAIYVSLFASIFLDALTQGILGITGAGIFFSLLLFSVIDYLTKFDSLVSKVVFSVLSLFLSIVIIRFSSFFSESLTAVDLQTKMREIVTQALVSSVVLILIGLFLHSRKELK